MIIAKIVQDGQVITLEETLKTFQYSANLQMQFVKDVKYKDYILIGWYRHLKKEEYLLDIDKDGIFTLGKDIFAKKGTVEFSFSLNKADEEIVHLGVIEYTIEQAFGSGDAILPEEQDTWIQVVSRVVEEQVSRIWDKDYKPQLEENLNIIETKTKEIKTAAMEVKQDALESSTNAQNALDSANIAKNSADNADLAKEKALEYSTNAEKFKNDASSYANQANLAKTEASKSATDASNSATSALDNANKAQQHLNSIVEKTNAFDIDYASKVENFNSNVENANNTLDAKIENANTDLDKKVLDANTNLDTKIADANSVIDGKVTVATKQANIATTKATELSQAVGKVKHLEDVVDTKLTQSYVSSPVIENGTISDSDEGQLRNLKIYGKCTQKVESDIVPTPDRPVPITSKKIHVGGETVELRSLKESVNLFDLVLLSKTELIPKTGAYRKIDIPLKLKPNTQYTFAYDSWEVPASSWVVLNIANAEGSILCGVFNINNTSTEPLSRNSGKHSFTTDATGYVYFNYYASGRDNLHVDLWFTKLLNNIMLVEGTTVPTSYIAPAVRDYKVVDHTNKRSYIERNVLLENNCGSESWVMQSNNEVYRTINNSTFDYNIANNIFCNKLEVIDYKDKLGDNQIRFSSYNNASIVVRINSTLTNSSLFVEWLKDNNFEIQLPLKEPIIEEIPYLESDTSEFGKSSQDSTSPSPNIKSPIETVKILNIKACAKNMFNPLDLSGGEIIKFNGVDCYKYTDSNNSFVLDFSHNTKARQFTFTTRFFREDNSDNGTYMYFVYEGGGKQRLQLTPNTIYNFKSDPSKVLKQIEGNYNYAKRCYIDLSVTQLEVGDTATDYEPYEETSISHKLEKPLVKCGDIADIIDLNNLERTDNCKIKTFVGNINENFGYDGLDLGDATRFNFVVTDAFGIEQNLPAFCDSFDYIQGDQKNTEGFRISKGAGNKYYLWFYIKKIRLKECTVSTFKEYLSNNPITVCYPATPTTEPLEASLIEKLKTLMSFYPITHIISNVPIQFDHKLNLASWHKVVSGQVEDARNIIYDLTVKQNNLEVMQLESALETQYNLDLMKLGGNLC